MVLKTVMVVDDSKEDRYIVSRQLNKTKRVGMIVENDTALDALAYLEALSQKSEMDRERPDVILLDINMPKVSGFEFLERFEQLCAAKNMNALASVPIYILTSSVSRSDKCRAAEYDVDGFICKPPSMEDLTSVLSKL